MLEVKIVRIEAYGQEDLETETLLSGFSEFVEYSPAAPPARVTWTQGARVGARPVAHEVANAVERLTVWALDAGDEALYTLNQELQVAQLWGESFRRDMKIVARVRDAARGGRWVEAQLFGGQAVWSDAVGKTLALTWVRAPYWQATDDVALTLTNDADSGTAIGIYNHEDEDDGHDNWVVVEAPEGNVPAPARIMIKNTHSAGRLGGVRMGWYDRPNYLQLEGEDSALPITSLPGSAHSNDTIGQGSAFKWELPQSITVDYVGMFKVLANGILGGTWQISAGYELTKLQTSRAVTGNSGWTDLGPVVLPPGGYVHPNRYPVSIWLDGSEAGALDYLLFMPMAQHRRLSFRGYHALPGTCIVDDGIREELVYDYAGQRFPILDSWGDQIEIWPEGLLPGSRQQMIVFALTSNVGSAEALRTAEISIWCRPRWTVLPYR